MKAPIPLIPPPEKLPPPIETDREIVAGYLTDASRFEGEAEGLVRAKDAEEIAALLAWAQRTGTWVTLSARRTSLTGASVPLGGLVLSLERLDAWLGIGGERARAQGGILLGSFQRQIEAAGWLYPPDPTSRNECSLGATVACNASGPRTYRYGPTRDHVRALSIVLPTGHRLEVERGEHLSHGEPFHLEERGGWGTQLLPLLGPSPTVKHAAGYHQADPYDLIDLFIGSEGTLGVITEVEVALQRPPERIFALFVFWPSETAGLDAVIAIRDADRAGRVHPLAIEWLDAPALDLLRTHDPSLRIPHDARCALYLEEGCQAPEEESRLSAWWRLIEETGAIIREDGVWFADTPRHREIFGEIRHRVPLAVNEIVARNRTRKFGTDFAVPDAALPEMMAAYRHWPEAVEEILAPDEKLRILAEVTGSPLPAHLPLPEALARLFSQARLGPPPRSPEEALTLAWQRLVGVSRIEHAGFGHIGQNHIHLNLLPKDRIEEVVATELYRKLAHLAVSLGGSVSAEHGIGKRKRDLLELQVGRRGIERMRKIKQALDPGGILCSGNLFPET